MAAAGSHACAERAERARAHLEHLHGRGDSGGAAARRHARHHLRKRQVHPRHQRRSARRFARRPWARAGGRAHASPTLTASMLDALSVLGGWPAAVSAVCRLSLVGS